MNTLKNLILLIGLIGTNLMADYSCIITKTTPSMQGGKEIYFGTVADYTKYVSKIRKNLAKRTALGAINGLSKGAQALAEGFAKEGGNFIGAGAGIGFVFSLLNPYVMSFYADQEFVLIRANNNGELESIMFIGDKHPSLSNKEIHKILKNK